MRRAALIPNRYGIGPDKILRQLRLMSDTLRAAGCTPTVCVTAANLDRHPALSAALSGFDLAVHGYKHVGYGALSMSQQAHDLSVACSSFAAHGLHARGFRAPYLQVNDSTFSVLSAQGLAFDSSRAHFVLPCVDGFATYLLRQAELRYGEVQLGPCAPYPCSGLVEVPVALPDDELLVDALRITNKSHLERVFGTMLDVTVEANSALILQIHPERFSLCKDAIRATLRKAADRGAWLATLTNIAEWSRQTSGSTGKWPAGSGFAVAVTGDLDALCIPDFWGRLWAGIS